MLGHDEKQISTVFRGWAAVRKQEGVVQKPEFSVTEPWIVTQPVPLTLALKERSHLSYTVYCAGQFERERERGGGNHRSVNNQSLLKYSAHVAQIQERLQPCVQAPYEPAAFPINASRTDRRDWPKHKCSGGEKRDTSVRNKRLNAEGTSVL